MRRGAESMPTIKRVEAEVDKINSSGILPPGVSIQRIYDRSDLIHVTTHTVLHNMVAGIVLIFLLQWAFLGNLRSAIIVATTIPFALSFAIGLMVLRGESANLLSVGAIDFGLVVDATVIMVENIFRHLAEAAAHAARAQRLAPHARAAADFAARSAIIAIAAAEVSQSIFFAAAIIIAGFVPLFTLSRHRGTHLRPMAKTYAYAIAGGLIATFTIAPALSLLLLPRQASRSARPSIVRWLRRVYEPALEFVLANRIITFAALALVVVAGVARRALAGTGIPAQARGGQSVGSRHVAASRSRSRTATATSIGCAGSWQYPEVQTVVSQHGRPDDGTDATGFFNAEFFVPLKPFDTWPAGVDKEKLTAADDRGAAAAVSRRRLQFLAVHPGQRRGGRIGGQGREFGQGLRQRSGDAGEDRRSRSPRCWPRCPGITDLAVLRSLGQPTIRIDVDRVRAARYGLAPGDVNAVVQAAIGGQSAGDLYEGGSDRHFPMMVRLAAPYRQSLDAIRQHSRSRRQPPPAAASSRCRSRMWPTCSWCPARRSSIASSSSATCRSSSACAAAISGGAVLEAQRAVESSRSSCRAATASNGWANSAICRRPSRG